MNASASPAYLNVFTVEEYEREGETARRWTRIGVAFPHSEGVGFNVDLNAFPRDGKLVVLPPNDTDRREESDRAERPAERAPRSPERPSRSPAKERRR